MSTNLLTNDEKVDIYTISIGELMIELDYNALYFFLPRIGMAIICGAIIGLEREISNKAAGLKTLVLICLGSSLFASMSVFMALDNPRIDNTRIIAQIVSGIGFLGAGVILQGKAGVVGMTSAAIVWFTAAIGVLIGIGHYDLAIIFSIISVTALIVFRWIEIKLNITYNQSTPHYYNLQIRAEPDVEILDSLHEIIRSNRATIVYSTLQKDANEKKIVIKYVNRQKNNSTVLHEVYKIKGILSIYQEETFKEGN